MSFLARFFSNNGNAKPVPYKTGITYYIFLAVLIASFFFSEIFLPGIAIICLISAFGMFRIMRRYKTHGKYIFFQSSQEELLEYERHIASSDYRSRYRSGLEESKWAEGFRLPFMLILTSLVLIVWHILVISPLWLLLICAWPLFILLSIFLEGLAERIIPKP